MSLLLLNCLSFFKQCHSQFYFSELQVMFVVLPGKTPIYAAIKRVGDTVVGLPTQCIRTANILKPSPQTISNLCLKVNTKLGGINSILLPAIRPKIFNEPIIFMGATISHAAREEFRQKPSIAAVVGSLDAHPARYGATVRTQHHREDSIDDLATMVRIMIFFSLKVEVEHLNQMSIVKLVGEQKEKWE